MCAPRAATNLAEAYDIGLVYMRNKHLSVDAPLPLPTKHWPKGNLEYLERYRAWLAGGGISELVIRMHHVKMASHVFALTLKPHHELDPDKDLDCALEYVKAKGLSAEWIKNCRNSLVIFRRFLRLERGLGEESKITPFDVPAHTQGLPAWLVNELQRYQRLQQRNWRTARLDLNIRGFWNKHGHMWKYLCVERGVRSLSDLKRQLVLDFLDRRLAAGLSATGVNNELRIFHSFLLHLQEEGYTVPNSLLRIRGPKVPDSLPRHLTDEQVTKLRDDFERAVQQALLPSRRRSALLDRAAFYLLWQGALRLGEVEELRLEDLELGNRRLTVRDGKGRVDRTVYLADSAVHALEQYLLARGEGSSDHVFLYRNATVKKDLISARIKDAGKRVGVKVHPHRLRHTCATQLLNAGCRVTSIQRFLGHKRLNTTMIYARAHDQTVADDYFCSMQRIEQKMEVAPGEVFGDQVVKVHNSQRALQLTEELALPDLPIDARISIAAQLRELLGPAVIPEPVRMTDAATINQPRPL